MIIVMKADTQPDSPELAQVIARAEGFPGVRTEVHRIEGSTRSVTEIYLLGSTGVVPTEPFEEFTSVERVVRVTEKFRSIGRHDAHLQAVGFDYNGIRFSQETLHVFPGVCAVDEPANLEATFAALKDNGVETSRAGVYKPRTSPYDFQGLGAACLPWVFELAGQHGIQVIAMEVCDRRHIDEILAALETTGQPTGVMLQIGTRNTQNFELLRAAGQQAELPVLFKRGMGITLEESLNACEYVASEGQPKVVFCLRGVKTHLGNPHRNLVDFAHVPVVRAQTRLPVCIDPSHSVGRMRHAPDGLPEVFHATGQGIVVGASMVLVDFHPDPATALCDGPQALTLDQLPRLQRYIGEMRRAYQACVEDFGATES